MSILNFPLLPRARLSALVVGLAVCSRLLPAGEAFSEAPPPSWAVEADWSGMPRVWDPLELLPYVEPPGEVHYLLATRPVIRLTTAPTHLRLPLPGREDADFSLCLLKGRMVRSAGEFLRITIDGRSPHCVQLRELYPFLYHEIVPSGPPAADFRFTLARGPESDAPEVPGALAAEITWATCVPLRREAFQRPGFEGSYIPIGDERDEWFIRDGFYLRESDGENRWRWTGRNFSLVAPVWPGTTLRIVDLHGILRPAISRRNVTLKIISVIDASLQANVATAIGITDFARHSFALREPLAPGLYRLEFELEETAPAEGDARELGLFLVGVGLR